VIPMHNVLESSNETAERPPALRTLLIEDCPDLAEVTAEFLREEGLEVRTARSGREALEVGTAFLPQLVLCDLNLPDMNGLEVARKLRSISSTAQSYIVILTAMPQRDLTEDEATRLGVDGFICKPITIDGLHTLLETIDRTRTTS